MVGGLGGSLRRTPARASQDSDAPSSRHPLFAIRTPVSQFKRKLVLPVETPAKPPSLSRFRRPPTRGEETPSRVSATPSSAIAAHAGSVPRKPTKSVTKPACIVRTSGGARGLRLGSGYSVAARGLQATVVNSEEVPHYELHEDPSFCKENNVQVVIRVRPLNDTEKSLHGYNRCLKQESAQSITWIGHPERSFTFDHVACESVNQEVLFRVVGLPIVENCIAGYNSCVFSYGQTGSGKTHTMLGEISDLGVKPGPEWGMIPRIFELLIERIRADEKLKYTCMCSFLEIYNDQITDLLDPSSTNLPLRKDTIVGAYVENLTKCEVNCVRDIITLLMQASENRKVSATNMNSASSRSHSVFTCTIEGRWEEDSLSKSRFARLNLVDLAGSERLVASGAEGERLKEATNINKSLSALSKVIMKLAEGTCGKTSHVPYRDSKLTSLLQDSLGGNSKTLIIANVSPSSCSNNETLNTLKFAQRARLIQNNAIVNEDSLGDLQTLQHQISVLKEELAGKEKYYEDKLKELENKMQEKDNDAAASLIIWHEEKEALEIEVSEAKGLAQGRSSEASALIAKFQEAHATMDTDSTVKALMEANENAKVQEEKYKQKESLFIIEKDDLLSEISSLKMLLDVKEQNYQDMEKKFESSLLEANEVALELEDGIRHLKNLLSENIEIFSSDVLWMKSKFLQLRSQLTNAVGELGAVSMENGELRSQLNVNERISYSMKEELAQKSNATERMEERLTELRNLLDERGRFLQILQNDFSKLSDEKKFSDSQVLILRDKLVMAQALAGESEAIALEARQIADERKKYAEDKDEEVKLLERSIDDLESTVCALEAKLASSAKSEQGTKPNKDEVINLKRILDAIQLARNYKKPSRDSRQKKNPSRVNSLG